MAEVQYAPMSHDKFYSPRRINSEPNFNHLTYPPLKRESFEAQMASAPSVVTDSPRNSVTSISTVSSCGSYFDTASNQSSIDPYEPEDTFSFPTYDDYSNTSSDKPTFIHLETSIGEDEEEEEDPPASPTNNIPKIITTAELPVTAIDDITLRVEPSRHVDYLSHKWKEEDIWASWRYMIGKRKVYDNAARLENASWRTWMKAKNGLKTVSPEKLNWMKDYDVTWLYGPLSTAPERSSFSISPTSPQCSSAPRNPCHHHNHKNTKKTILKKRSMSEVLLQRSISSSNLLRQATASIRSQQSQNHHRLSRPVMPNRAVSDYATYPFISQVPTTGEGTSETTSALESGIESPSSSRKHIHFNDRVEQCIAVEAKDEDEEMDVDMGFEEEEDSSDEGGLCLNMSSRPKTGRQDSKGGSSEPQTIQKLPSTTLKAEMEPSELKQSTSSNNLSALLFGASSPSSSKSSLGTGTAFVFNDEDEDDPIEWEPKWSNRRDSVSINRGRFGDLDDEYGGFAECPPTPPSGNEGIFGRAVDAVNTARDIAHVFWNVGWASRR
ncbi:hypothetical protein ABW20_dc0107686 [Dactylellina cionopaga]|nr:hypothetical protein ABW20_dc0107686 [Dactylellina cionopaga]